MLKSKKPITKNLITAIEKFHSDNLFIPTRTIYFGKGFDLSEDSDIVNSMTASQTIKNLHILDFLNHYPITLLLNTVGGSWEDGIAIFDVINAIKSKTYIIGLGKIYSMGSVILQSGYKRFLMKNSLMMIHDGFDGYIGDSKSFEAWATVSKEIIRPRMYDIYYKGMKKMNKRIKILDIERMCSHDKVFTALEAVDCGLADKII